MVLLAARRSLVHAPLSESLRTWVGSGKAEDDRDEGDVSRRDQGDGSARRAEVERASQRAEPLLVEARDGDGDDVGDVKPAERSGERQRLPCAASQRAGKTRRVEEEGRTSWRYSSRP